MIQMKIRLKTIWYALRKCVMKQRSRILNWIDPHEPVEQVVIKKKHTKRLQEVNDFDRLKFKMQKAREDDAMGMYDEQEFQRKMKHIKQQVK
jgi:hypothetical protein